MTLPIGWSFFLVETGGLVAFLLRKNYCVAAVQPSASNSPPDYCILFSSPQRIRKRKTTPNGVVSFWWRLGDSNPRPHACEASRGDAPCRGRSNQPKNRCKHLTFGWSAFADRLFSFYLDRMPIADGILSHGLFTKQDLDLILYTSSHNFLHPRASQNNREQVANILQHLLPREKKKD